MIKLDWQGRYIQGPRFNKYKVLDEHGAVPIEDPRDCDIADLSRVPEGMAAVVVVSNRDFTAALWVKDEKELARTMVPAHLDPRPRQWYLMPKEHLEKAEILDMFDQSYLDPSDG